MVSLAALWLPILLSAVLVFVASSVIHMALGYHASDWDKVPDEDRVMGALREAGVAPGDYHIPKGEGMKAMKDPEFMANYERGPVALLTVLPPGPPRMGKALFQWFVYCAVVGLFAAYLAGRTLPAGAEYLAVFRVAGTVAFAGYVLALWQNSIWFGRKWSATLKSSFDGAIYALLTAGVFGWLWP